MLFQGRVNCYPSSSGNCADLLEDAKTDTNKPLTCGYNHEIIWGKTGYHSDNHWCKRTLKELNKVRPNFKLLEGNKLYPGRDFDADFGETQEFIELVAYDQDGNYHRKGFEIKVLNKNDPPLEIVASPHQLQNKQVWFLHTIDPDNYRDWNNEQTVKNKFELVDGDGDTDNAKFEIKKETIDNVMVSYLSSSETLISGTSYAVRIKALDDTSLEKIQALTIKYDSSNEPPSKIAFEPDNKLKEGTSADQVVGVFTVTDSDSDDSHSIRIIPDPHYINAFSYFKVDGDNLVTKRKLDRAETFRAAVYAEDSRGQALQQTIEIEVSPVNDPPSSLYLDTRSVFKGGSADDLFVGRISVGDPDTWQRQLTVEFGSDALGSDNNKFEIALDSAGKYTLSLKESISSSESRRYYRLSLRASDGVSEYEKFFL